MAAGTDTGTDTGAILGLVQQERVRYKARWTIRRFASDETFLEGRSYSESVIDGNLLLNEGLRNCGIWRVGWVRRRRSQCECADWSWRFQYGGECGAYGIAGIDEQTL